jgi:hypothetical protein
VYGKNLTAKEIALEEKTSPPPSAAGLLSTLDKHAGKR